MLVNNYCFVFKCLNYCLKWYRAVFYSQCIYIAYTYNHHIKCHMWLFFVLFYFILLVKLKIKWCMILTLSIYITLSCNKLHNRFLKKHLHYHIIVIYKCIMYIARMWLNVAGLYWYQIIWWSQLHVQANMRISLGWQEVQLQWKT